MLIGILAILVVGFFDDQIQVTLFPNSNSTCSLSIDKLFQSYSSLGKMSVSRPYQSLKTNSVAGAFFVGSL